MDVWCMEAPADQPVLWFYMDSGILSNVKAAMIGKGGKWNEDRTTARNSAGSVKFKLKTKYYLTFVIKGSEA